MRLRIQPRIVALLALAFVATAAGATRGAAESFYREAEQQRAANLLDDAIGSYLLAMEADPTFAPAFVGLGIAYGQQGRLDDATAAFSSALQLDPKNASARAGLGNVHSLNREHAAAVEQFRLALELDPGLLWVRMSLAGLLHLLERPDDALEQYGVVLEANPTNPLAHMGVGAIHLKRMEFASAITAFDRALELKPDLWQAMYNRGVARSKSGDDEGAIPDLNAALQGDPNNAMARMELGNVYQQLGDHERAVAEYEALLPVMPNEVELRRHLLRSYLRLGKADRAQREREVVQRLRERQERIMALEFRLRDEPDEIDGYVELGGLYLDNDQPGEALRAYKRASERDPNRLAARNGTATALMRRGRLKEAAAVCHEAARRHPEATGPRILLSRIHARQGNSERALEELLRAKEIAHRAVAMARNATTLESLASVYAAMGNLDLTIATLEDAIQLDPEREDLRKRLDQVKSVIESQMSDDD